MEPDTGEEGKDVVVVVNDLTDLSGLCAKVSQGPVGPDEEFSGTYGEFWLTVELAGRKAVMSGTYRTGRIDTFLDRKAEYVRLKLERVNKELREQYITHGSVAVNLSELARTFIRV